MDILNNVGTDGRSEDGGDGVGGRGSLAIGTQNRDGRSGGHCEGMECALFKSIDGVSISKGKELSIEEEESKRTEKGLVEHFKTVD